MKIGIDARLWSQTGVGRYIQNLVRELQKVDKKNSYVLFVTKNDRGMVEKKLTNSDWSLVTADSRWHSLHEQIQFPKIVNRQNLDLMHFPYFSAPIFYKKPFVVTIHDLILHHYPTGEASTMPLWLYGFKMIMYRVVINSAARRSKKIIAVSNSTKKEIVDHLRINPDKVLVTYEAANDPAESSLDQVDLKNYFLFVGNVYPHKNVEKLIKAFKILLQTRPDLKLVFVGKEDFFYKRLRKGVKKLEESGNVIFRFDASDSQLSSLYKKAIALVRPSLMEGFSLPLLEAMENKCLVVASDIPVHREIFEEAVIYFDPKNELDIAQKLDQAASLKKESLERYLEKGSEIASQFSWEKTARETQKVYESSLSI